MKCFEITNCSEKDRKSCYVWTSFQSSPEELDNIGCWVFKDIYKIENKAQLAKCKKCNYYRMMNRDNDVQADTRTDIATITCNGIINSDKTHAIERVWATLKQNGKYNVIFDLSQVNNIYSCGLGLLVNMHKDALANNGMLVVTGVQGYALAIFTSTKLSKLLFMAADKTAAAELFELQRRKIEEAIEAEKRDQESQEAAKRAAAIKPQKKKMPCWEFFENQHPEMATSCDECFKKISTSSKPCWIVDGLIEDVSFQYIDDKCESCDYFLEFGSSINSGVSGNIINK